MTDKRDLEERIRKNREMFFSHAPVRDVEEDERRIMYDFVTGCALGDLLPWETRQAAKLLLESGISR